MLKEPRTMKKACNCKLRKKGIELNFLRMYLKKVQFVSCLFWSIRSLIQRWSSTVISSCTIFIHSKHERLLKNFHCLTHQRLGQKITKYSTCSHKRPYFRKQGIFASRGSYVRNQPKLFRRRSYPSIFRS